MRGSGCCWGVGACAAIHALSQCGGRTRAMHATSHALGCWLGAGWVLLAAAGCCGAAGCCLHSGSWLPSCVFFPFFSPNSVAIRATCASQSWDLICVLPCALICVFSCACSYVTSSVCSPMCSLRAFMMLCPNSTHHSVWGLLPG